MKCVQGDGLVVAGRRAAHAGDPVHSEAAQDVQVYTAENLRSGQGGFLGAGTDLDAVSAEVATSLTEVEVGDTRELVAGLVAPDDGALADGHAGMLIAGRADLRGDATAVARRERTQRPDGLLDTLAPLARQERTSEELTTSAIHVSGYLPSSAKLLATSGFTSA